MSFKLITQSPNMPPLDYLVTASTAYTAGKVAYDNSGVLSEDAGSQESTTLTIEAVVDETKTSGAAPSNTMKCVPIIHGAGQLWVADCTNVTAANQMNKDHQLTSATHLENNSTPVTTTAGVFHTIAIVGAVGGTKVLGYFIKLKSAAA